MGSCRYTLFHQSILDAAKGFAALLIICSLASCTQKVIAPKINSAGSPAARSIYKERTRLGIQLTDAGQNSRPQFSPNGEEIFYISENRWAHKQAQLYKIDLGSYQERRLTFQNGQVFDAIALSDDEICYSSTTDEAKEHPLLFYPEATPPVYPATEIYLATLDGQSINRLTSESGFDGFIQAVAFRPESITFSRLRDQQLQLWQLNTKTLSTILLRAANDKSITNATYSDTAKKWLWTEIPADGKIELWIGEQKFRNVEQLKLEGKQLTNPQWIPGQEKISFINAQEKTWELQFWDLKNQCLGSILKHDEKIQSVSWSPKQDQLAIASDVDGSNQITVRAVDINSLTCGPSLPQ